MNPLIGKRKGIKATIFCLFLGLGLIGSLIYGIYLLVVSLEDPHSAEVIGLEEIINKWEASIPNFENLTVSITPEKGSEVYLNPSIIDDGKFHKLSLPNYPHLKYFRNDTLIGPLYTNYKIIHNPKDWNEYNVTANMTLHISSLSNPNLTTYSYLEDIVIHKREKYPLVMKMCENHNTGYFNGTVQTCYYHFNLTKMCLEVNETTLELVDSYRNGCEGLGLEYFEPMVWRNANNPPNYEAKVVLEVRSSLDPYIYLSNSSNTDFPPTQTEYAIIGLVVLIVSALLIIIPVTYFCKKKKQKNLRHFELEMSNRQNYA